MIIRAATQFDADEGSILLRRSITELCHADHNGDPKAIAAWIANKTPENWRRWIYGGDSSLLVAVESGRLVGVGMIDTRGSILLNYVLPEARQQGVSKALLTHMECLARISQCDTCRLTSTRTAFLFYRSVGYGVESAPDTNGIAMSKWLRA